MAQGAWMVSPRLCPPPEPFGRLTPGHLVKLEFLLRGVKALGKRQRMWVQVKSGPDERGQYGGTLCNTPIFGAAVGLVWGSEVRFRPEDVIEVQEVTQ